MLAWIVTAFYVAGIIAAIHAIMTTQDRPGGDRLVGLARHNADCGSARLPGSRAQ